MGSQSEWRPISFPIISPSFSKRRSPISKGGHFKIFPDFPTGGIMDKSQYDKGRGKIKLRAKIEIKDPKTLVIREICYGTTTESLIRSIDEAAKKGKIKIEAINDYTAKRRRNRDQTPARTICRRDLRCPLWLYRMRSVSQFSDHRHQRGDFLGRPMSMRSSAYNAEKLVEFLKRELEIERDRLLEKIFYKTLERIFIENRLYKKIETVKTLEGIHETLEDSFKPFRKKLLREPTHEDREKLLQIPIRRISQFDIDKNKEEIIAPRREACAKWKKILKT